MKKTLTLLTIVLAQLVNSQTINIVPFATGLSSPVDISHPVDDARLFVVQKTGAIRIVNADGTIKPNNFLTLTTATISNGSERGLLGLTFHPNYATNGYFYVNYTNTAGNTVIARYTVSANPDIADTTSATILLTITQPYSNHNGGSLKFGPDGYLYIGMGDGGDAGDPQNRAQNINENLGKILRIDVDSASPYGIPADNPFAGALTGNDEIWAIGVRNPWKFNFDRLNGDLWIADVGQNQIEEIDHVVAPITPGLNFGWKCYEGNSVFSACTIPAIYTFPVAQYSHTAGACSITGGYSYTGSLYPNFSGKYFFADYCNNKIGLLDATTNLYTWTAAFSGTNFTTFGEDRNGELYVAGVTNGIVYKIVDTSLNILSSDKDKFEIYPNPAQNEVFLKTKGLQFPGSITISDSTGKTVLHQTVTSETNTIGIATLQTGLYIVSIKDQTGLSISSKLSVK
jgi:glucose/arabinose dehydrogenase